MHVYFFAWKWACIYCVCVKSNIYEYLHVIVDILRKYFVINVHFLTRMCPFKNPYKYLAVLNVLDEMNSRVIISPSTAYHM